MKSYIANPQKIPHLAPMSINPIDLVLALFLGYGFIQGFRKGLLVEVASLAALVLGLWGAFIFADVAKNYLQIYFDLNPAMLAAAAYLSVFVGIAFAISLIAKTLTKIINMVALGLINRLLGAFFGTIKIGLMLSAFLYLISRINFLITLIEPSLLEASLLFEPILSLGQFFFEWVIDFDAVEIPPALI